MDAELAAQIEAVRRFNRFYTAALGLLDRAHLGSPFSLAETRVLYELAHREDATASVLAAELGLDPGYLSRILARLGRLGLVERAAVAGDARRSRLSLTGDGHAALGPLQERTRAELARRARRSRLQGRIKRIIARRPRRPACRRRRRAARCHGRNRGDTWLGAGSSPALRSGSGRCALAAALLEAELDVLLELAQRILEPPVLELQLLDLPGHLPQLPLETGHPHQQLG
jgi:DNA-binding MarR family transcriptional regulator